MARGRLRLGTLWRMRIGGGEAAVVCHALEADQVCISDRCAAARQWVDSGNGTAMCPKFPGVPPPP
jgi:hypothetical protein